MALGARAVFAPLTLILPSGSLSMLISLLAVIRCFCVLRPEWCQPGSVPPMQCESVLVLRLFRETNEPEQARGPFEQVLPRGGEGQAHVTFTEFAERASGCNGYVLALDEGSGKLHRGHAGLGDVGPHVEGAGGSTGS